MVLVMNADGKELVSFKGVKWVFFDMGGVLVDSGPLFSYIAQRLPTHNSDLLGFALWLFKKG
jgi:FMN phosphatase YigB (HAD superfamily)